MKLKDHEEWIRYNAPHMTVFDMMDELDVKDIKGFREFCKRNQIVPLTEGDKKRKYVLELYQTKSKQFIADKLNIKIDRVSQIYNELGIQEPDFTAPKPKTIERNGLSVRQIFQRCHIPNARIR